MTVRAVTLGMLAAIAIASLTYLNDWVLRLYWLVSNHLPVSVYGLAMLLVLAFNPVASRLARGWPFDRRELAVMVSLALVGGGLGGAGLFRNFPHVLVAPLELAPGEAAWQNARVLRYVPAPLLPRADGAQYQRTVGVLTGGMRPAGGGRIHVAQVPWGNWRGTLALWLPLIALLMVGLIALAVVLHRQWSHHELLRYPIAEFAGTLLDTDGRRWPPALRRRGFWIALLAVLGVHLLNGLAARRPGLVRVPLTLDFSQAADHWEWLTKGIGGGDMFYPTLYVSAAAFVLFMRGDVAVSLGISGAAMAVGSAVLVAAGFSGWGTQGTGGYLPWLSFGAYVGFAAMILYTGRHFYAGALARALRPGWRGRQDVPAGAAWAVRVAMACLAGVTALLIVAGLPWTLALLFVGLVVVLMVVLGRISAETGLFHLGLIWSPVAVLLGLLGAEAAGPTALAVAGLVGGALLLDPRETLLPFVLNGLRLCQQAGAPVHRTARWMAATVLVALPVAAAVVFWTQYNFGRAADEWSTRWIPHQVFDTVSAQVIAMRYADTLAASEGYGPLERIGHANPDPAFLWSAGIGLALVLGTSAARLRWTWWPIHPVLFVVWGTWAMGKLAPSILLGVLVRTAIVRVGGARALQDLRPAAVGAIAGDLLGAMVFMVAGVVHYALTGTAAPVYNPYTG